ncbi:glutamate--tRNA ligase [soil metagenome]
MNGKPRYRFAPSPTGSLHVGGARTAILNWLLARKNSGAFVLRVEDTDLDRNVPGAEDRMLEDLHWLGLDWDEGPGVGGAHGPYRQSERTEGYRVAAEALIRTGFAYFCTCPPSVEAGADRRVSCACADRAGETAWSSGASLRFLAPTDGEILVRDLIRGDVTFPAESVEDFVLLRSDGRATYNFAAAVDDAAMKITHVIRGADHLNNSPKQVLIYQALNLTEPLFGHIPLILGPDRHKLSKRHGATSVSEHKRLGYLPEALVNYLSLLSWSSPTGEEFLETERLMEEVDLERVGASDAVFDPEKLRWLSHRHLQTLTVEELQLRAQPFLGDSRRAIEPHVLPHALAAVQERISVLSELDGELEPFRGPASADQMARRSSIGTDAAAVALLRAAADRIQEVDWEPAEIGTAFREVGKQLGFRGRTLFLPLRVALTGDEHGPDLARITYVLGRARAVSLLRLEELHV